jgi:hypothetical protein
VECVSGCAGSGGTAVVDKSAFTPGTSSLTPVGGTLDDTSPSTLAEGEVGAARLTANRGLHVNLRNASGTEIAQTTPLAVRFTDGTNFITPSVIDTDDSSVTGGQADVGLNIALPRLFDGTNWTGRHLQAANALNATGTGLATAQVVGQFDDTSPTTVTENQFGNLRMSAKGVLYGTIRDAAGNERGANVDASNQLTVTDAATGVTTDAAATVGSTGSLSAKLRLMTSQLDSILATLQVIDNDQTGASVHYRTSVGTTEDEHEIKATAGRLFSIAVTNTNAAARYLRCYNLTAANTTPGTSTVFFGLAIPGATTGAGFTHNFGPKGLAFGTALTCALTTGAADSDVAEVAANEIKVIYTYE